ncbi:SIR2 family NAD-dependent protein deacylase [Hymenobacter arizonensis]|uniref:SIR2-like domain-containing protein n=1 Tax=Hymenobacter arizonensis TaxID=1227077 RepID=A0A1I5YXV2_HYMAR|nr:SIR2 family protein [Hymenobacter arizonensis]SFQ49044.1 SIR2-like domain-containing protein [Hymenobacter arizonensis]
MHSLVASFPDLHHLTFLRERLWARQPLGRAAVMVGTGFSLNADSKVAGAPPFPLWRELTGLLLDQLRPALNSVDRKTALDQAVSGSGSLTLALEFEATFGRSALDDLIINCVPDQDHTPGSMHQALLSLPWADVFTTNYDTLLERTPTSEHNRYYDVVVHPADLPNTTQPRIVKLHGSLPASKPFILTEEDFRRYPKAFAPFVNTVQQAMMENDFVLLGFSGDDPNFLAWLGWVRDELATLRARVYLCGILDLSSAQRLVLRERGVTAIDLGYLFPKNSYPDNSRQRNQDALAWLLYSLANGEGAGQEIPLFWPYFPTLVTGKRQKLALPPLEAVTQEAFVFEDRRRSKHAPVIDEATKEPSFTSEAASEIQAVLAHWKRARMVYPGWVALPRENRESLQRRTQPWRYTIENWARTLAGDQRLEPLAELVWRLERGMMVIESEMSEQLYQATLEDTAIPQSPALREQWATIAFYYLKHLRYEFTPAAFEQLLTLTEPLAAIQPRYAAWRCWQAAQQRLEQLDQEGARRWLRRWPDVVDDPVWDLRRAGLWAEVGDLDLAERYASFALNMAVKRQPKGKVRIDMLAVEADARRRLTQIREASWLKRDGREPVEDLWNATRQERDRDQLYLAYRCEASAEVEHLEDVLNTGVPEVKRAIYQSINPHSGMRVRTRTSGGGFEVGWLQPAFDVLDSFEVRGHQFRLSNRGYTSLNAASSWLVDIYPSRALGIILRTANDKLLMRFLDKATVLSLSEEQLHPLFEQCLQLLESHFPLASSGCQPGFNEDSNLTSAALAMLVIGRTLFRLPEELRSRAVKAALAVWAQWPYELLRRRNLRLRGEHYNEFTRGIVAVMTAEDVATYLTQLLTATPISSFSPGPFNALPDHLFPTIRPETEEMTAAVHFCLSRVAASDLNIRQSALRRLDRLHGRGWLTPMEQALYGELVWQTAPPSALPNLNNWFASFLLHVPSPAGVDAAALLKQDLVRRAAHFQDALTIDISEDKFGRGDAFGRFLTEIARATKPEPGNLTVGGNHRRSWIEWTPAEAEMLFDLLEAWLHRSEQGLIQLRQVERGELFHFTIDEDNFDEAGQVLREAIIPNLPADDVPLSERVYALLQKMIQLELRGRSALPLLIDRLPTDSEALHFTATSIRQALMHPSDSQIVGDGVEGVCRWAYRFYNTKLGTPPPESLLYEFTVRLSMTELPNLLVVADWTANLLLADPHIIWPTYAQALGDALRVLADATKPPSWMERNLARTLTAQERIYQRPRIREKVANIAAQLSKLNEHTPVLGIASVLEQWRQLATLDPLPEVGKAWQKGFNQLPIDDESE